jgi:hypothetical protein
MTQPTCETCRYWRSTSRWGDEQYRKCWNDASDRFLRLTKRTDLCRQYKPTQQKEAQT